MAGLNIPIGGDLAPFLAVIAQFKSEMGKMAKTVRSATSGAGRSAKEAVGGFKILKDAGVGAMKGIAAAARALIGTVSGMAGKLKNMIPGGGMLGPLAGLASIAGAVAIAISSFKVGAEVAGGIEQTSIALTALTGSGDTAKRVLDDMRATWLRTGATIEDQSGSIRKFIALGFSPDDALKLNKNIMDVSGAVGMTADQSTLLASALAQVKAKGIVSMEELRQQIAEKGIPVFDALAAKLNVTKGALIKMVSDGKVPADALLDIFLNMEGTFGKFVGGADRMGLTFLGLVSRLKGAWSLFMAEFAAPIIDHLKPILNRAIGMLESWKEKARGAGTAIGQALLAAFALIQDGKALQLFQAGFRFAIQGALDLLMRGLKGAIAFLAAALPPVFEAAMATLRDPMFWDGLGKIFIGLAQLISAEISRALGQQDVAIAKEAGAGVNLKQGGQMISASGGGYSASDVIAEALFRGTEEAVWAMSGEASDGFKAAKDDLKELLDTMRAKVAALKKEVQITIPQTNGEAPPDEGTDPVKGGKAVIGTLAESQVRYGGLGFGMTFTPMITEAKKSNGLLAQIAKNTSKAGGKTPVIA